MNISLERVLRFVAVAENLSFTRAAKQLHIDQPWLSRQIMQLEEQLGFTLFNRSGLRITLTAEGEEFLERAREVVAVSQRIRQKAEEMKRRSQAELRIGMPYAVIPLRAREDFLERYKAVCPNVTLDLSAYEHTEPVFSQLDSGDLDFALVFGPADNLDLKTCILGVIKLRLAIPEEDPLAQKSVISVKDFKGRRIAVGEMVDGYEKMFSWLNNAGVIKVPVLGGWRFIFDVAEKERLPVICYTGSEKLPDGFVTRPIGEDGPRVYLSLVRRRGTLSPVAERMWRLGNEFATEHALDEFQA
jgi:DNA-binding transcriptional LysR family regulator